jgi:phospholipase A1
MKTLTVVLSAMILALASLSGQSANVDHCRMVETDLERLACYDEAIGRSTADLSEETVMADESESTAVAAVTEPSDSPFSDRLAREANMDESAFAILAHQRNYLLPVTYNSKINTAPFDALYPDVQMDDIEAKFQISFKARLLKDFLGGDLWGAYTQQNWWQVYNSEESAPFRETNYQPEAIMVWDNDWKLGAMTNTKLTLGFNHQSNGRGEGLSRSWNRLMAGAAFEKSNFFVAVRAWYRLPEDDEDDDNPNMDDYYGHGDISLVYKLNDMELAGKFRNNLKGSGDNKGSMELEWTKPVNNRFKWYIQYFYGYGESLIDYDVKTNRIGVGFALNNLI